MFHPTWTPPLRCTRPGVVVQAAPQRLGFGRGVESELVLQHLAASLVLPKRRSDIAVLPMKSHQQAMAVLLQWGEGHQPLRGGKRIRSGFEGHNLLQGHDREIGRALPFTPKPFLESGVAYG